MINTNSFKTKTIFIKRKNPSVKNLWGLSIDVGFSSVKVYSPNSITCFPSYARKLSKEQKFVGKASKKNILYEDENGEIWLVGQFAQNMINAGDTDSSNSGLFIKDRFSSPMFKVIARVGMALGMTTNEYGCPEGKTLAVQTGLPPLHMDSCTDDLKEALAGEHNFKIKIGEEDWQTVQFSLPIKNIKVMEQPMGSLVAISTDNNGGSIPDAAKYLNSNLLVLDPGFGTTDTFNIVERCIVGNSTWSDLGMKRVFQETCSDINSQFTTDITVAGLQKLLEDGEIRVTNRKEKKSRLQPFGDVLEAASKRICREMLEKVDESYQGLFNHDYLVVTGGLGAAWFSQIQNYYKEMETLKVIPGTQNDTIDGIFSNVRGYYMNQLDELKRAA